MFERLLIANRGEIACRIARTARRLGVHSIAVYSAADANACHVREADSAYHIGPAAAGESYLNIAALLAAARASSAQAVHPGYGFLSENAELAEACAAAGLIFVGPTPAAMRAMGAKREAKVLMAAAGLPLLPGYHAGAQDDASLQAAAQALGYPLMIKASAGGGGRGIRVVRSAAELAPALAACRREASAAFADDSLLLEQYLEHARHVEVQVFGDQHGNLLPLFDRDCSLQRRHQKVLEEAPAPGLDEALRAAMAQAAVAAARAVGYVGAGTVEFILAPDGRFFFLEMNTRLQVEHPVSEMITGLDLVEWQLRVAAGEPLPLTQQVLQRRGHAIEVRLYAEDPARGFLPASGRIEHLEWPAQHAQLRIDAGYAEGDTVSPYYDAMLAKLVAWDTTREGCRQRLLQALAQLRLVGVAHNGAFLSHVLASPAFAAALLDTGLIERLLPSLPPASSTPPWQVLCLAALYELCSEAAQATAAPWDARDGWRLGAPAWRPLHFADATGKAWQIEAQASGQGWLLRAAGHAGLARAERGPRGLLRAELDGHWVQAWVLAQGTQRDVFLHAPAPNHYVLTRLDPLLRHIKAAAAADNLRAPLPGRIVSLLVTPGSHVAAGSPLLVMEAMKMEHTLCAPGAGSVLALHCALGDAVREGTELLDFRPD